MECFYTFSSFVITNTRAYMCACVISYLFLQIHTHFKRANVSMDKYSGNFCFYPYSSFNTTMVFYIEVNRNMCSFVVCVVEYIQTTQVKGRRLLPALRIFLCDSN